MRVSLPDPPTCPPSSKRVPGVKLGVTCDEEWNWPPYLTMLLLRITPLNNVLPIPRFRYGAENLIHTKRQCSSTVVGKLLIQKCIEPSRTPSCVVCPLGFPVPFFLRKFAFATLDKRTTDEGKSISRQPRERSNGIRFLTRCHSFRLKSYFKFFFLKSYFSLVIRAMYLNTVLGLSGLCGRNQNREIR